MLTGDAGVVSEQEVLLWTLSACKVHFEAPVLVPGRCSWSCDAPVSQQLLGRSRGGSGHALVLCLQLRWVLFCTGGPPHQRGLRERRPLALLQPGLRSGKGGGTAGVAEQEVAVQGVAVQGVAVLPAGQEVPPSLHAGCRGRRCPQGLPLAAGLQHGGARPPCPADPQPQQCDHGGCLGPTRELLEQSRAAQDMHRPKLCPKLPRTPRNPCWLPLQPGQGVLLLPPVPPCPRCRPGAGKGAARGARPCMALLWGWGFGVLGRTHAPLQGLRVCCSS